MGFFTFPVAATFELNAPSGDVSIGLWLLAATVALLAAHVSLGWVRISQRRPGLRRSWGAVLVACGALGSGIWAAGVLTLAGEPMDFWLGYRTSAVVALWLGAVLGCLPPLLALSYGPAGATVALCGSLLGLLAGGVQAGWLSAAGFLPGIHWQLPVLLVALMLMMVGFGAALALALARVDRDGGQRTDLVLRRLGAAGVLGASLFAGQEIMVLGVGLPQQKASAYIHETPDSVLNVIGGGLVPALLAGMAGHLELRRQQRRRGSGRNNFSPLKRRKRRPREHGA